MNKTKVIDFLTQMAVDCNAGEIQLSVDEQEAIETAIYMLTPRILTPNEVRYSDYAYIEGFGDSRAFCWFFNDEREDGTVHFIAYEETDMWLDWRDYGVNWRAWSAEPTYEQMEREGWNE